MTRTGKRVLAAGFSILGLVAASASAAPLVTPGSTFDISVYGFTGSGGSGSSEIVVGPITATFGATGTFNAQVLGSTQVTTVSSSESIVGSQTIDTVTLSVPTNFDAADLMIGGQPITGLFLDIGEAIEATSGPVTQNGLQLNFPINVAFQSSSGTASTSSVGNVPIVPPPTSSFNGTDTQIYAYEGVQRLGGGDINIIGVNGFTYVSAVPEPMSGAILGVAAGFGLLRRRRRA